MESLPIDYESLSASLHNLAFHLNAVSMHGDYRTVAIYFDNRTTFIASILIGLLSVMTPSIYVTINLDQIIHPILDNDLGSNTLNICVLDNIIDRKYESISFDSQHHTYFLSSSRATDAEISTFFKNVWSHSVIKAGLVFWIDSIKIYSFHPYQGKYLVKIYDSQTEEVEAHKDWFAELFEYRTNNLANTSFRVFLASDPPKVFRAPPRLRFGTTYYFSGRDGLIARIASLVLNGHWQYHTLSERFDVINFRPAKIHANVVVERAPNVVIESGIIS